MSIMDYVKAYVFPGILVKAYEGLLLEGLIGFFFNSIVLIFLLSYWEKDQDLN